MMEARVKFRLVYYYVPTTDLITGNQVNTRRDAVHGQILHTEEGINTETDLYGVPQEWIDRLAQLGAFYTPAEEDAFETGALPAALAESPLQHSVGTDSVAHPLTFGEASAEQLEDYLRSNPHVDDVLDAIGNEPTTQAQELLANKFLTASIEVDYADHHALQEGAAGLLGLNTAASGMTEDPAGSGASGADPEGPDVTEAAERLAKEEGVNLADVKGTGSQGRVTEKDVKDHLAAQGGQS